LSYSAPALLNHLWKGNLKSEIKNDSKFNTILLIKVKRDHKKTKHYSQHQFTTHLIGGAIDVGISP
jgi:hypothetical protein